MANIQAENGDRFPKKKDKKITFRLDSKRALELERIAFREGFGVSFIVRHLVCRYLEDQRRFKGGK